MHCFSLQRLRSLLTQLPAARRAAARTRPQVARIPRAAREPLPVAQTLVLVAPVAARAARPVAELAAPLARSAAESAESTNESQRAAANGYTASALHAASRSRPVRGNVTALGTRTAVVCHLQQDLQQHGTSHVFTL